MTVHVEIDPRIRWARDGSVIAKPIEIRVSHFHEGAVREFRAQLDEALGTSQPVVAIFVDSYGGSLHGLVACLDAIDSVRGSVGISTIASGKAMSAAAVLLAAGDPGLRFVSQNSSIMVHECSGGSWGKNVEIQADAKEQDRLNKLLLARMDRDCGHKPGYFSKLIHDNGHADLFLTPKQALVHGIADDIGVPHLALAATVEYAFGLPKSQVSHRHTRACKHTKKAAK
jgi:ATP-dependent Clp endopeptidase proteolytic subunit ClpP